MGGGGVFVPEDNFKIPEDAPVTLIFSRQGLSPAWSIAFMLG